MNLALITMTSIRNILFMNKSEPALAPSLDLRAGRIEFKCKENHDGIIGKV